MLFYKNDRKGFVLFRVYGEGGFFLLGDEVSESYCYEVSDIFNGLEDTTLTGKNGTWSGPYHRCTLLIAFHLE